MPRGFKFQNCARQPSIPWFGAGEIRRTPDRIPMRRFLAEGNPSTDTASTGIRDVCLPACSPRLCGLAAGAPHGVQHWR